MLVKLRFSILSLGLWFFVSCSVQQVATPTMVYENYPLTKAVPVDSTSNFVQLIDGYREQLKAKMSRQVGYSGMYMPIDKPQSLLSNMVADFTYELGNTYCKQQGLTYSVDAAIINIRGLRKAMPQGNITLGDIYEISPFENKLFIVAMYGKDLRKLFDHITRSGGEGVGNVQLIAHKETQKLKEVLIGGLPLEDKKLYHVISIDYLINGGDGMAAFSKKVSSVDMNLKSRDALLEYVQREYKAQRPLKSSLNNRIRYE